jgi:hypothetical protein
LSHYNTKTKRQIKRVTPKNRQHVNTYLDGGCGLSSVIRTAKAIGLNFN